MTSKTPRDLTLRLLIEQAPERYRSWVRVGILTAVVGYTLSLSAQLWEHGWDALSGMREPYVILGGLVAFALERSNRLRAASLLVLGLLWCELHVTLVVAGLHSSSVSVLSPVVLGTTLFLGTRPAFGLALSALASIPAALALRSEIYGTPFLAPGELTILVVLEAVIVSTALLLGLFMHAFGRVLQTSERNAARARELIDGAPDAIFSVNQQGNIEDCNPKAERLLGLSRQDVLGSELSKLGLRELGSDRAMRVSLDTLSESSREYVVVNTGLELEGLLRMVSRPDGTRGALIVLRDVTQRKRAERRAQELQHQLLHAQKLEAVGQLAGGIAHDINNLLTAVGGYGDLLAWHSDPFIRETATELMAARDRGTGLTRQLLAFARKELAQPRGMDLAETLSGMDRLLHRLAGEQIRLEIDARGPAVIFADPGQIEQVVVNLVMNAKDALPDGGLLRISCRPQNDEAWVELGVEDTGCGMSEATRRRVFEPFFTTKPRGRGTGLGLSTVHGIVETSGGRIDLVSRVGKGTKFTLTWPAYEAVDPVESAPTPELSSYTPRGRVLLVEDDPQSRAFLVQLLANAGFEVNAVNDGRQALEKFGELERAHTPVEILLSDVRMPGMTGFEVAALLRRQRPDLPVLFMSGYVEPELDAAGFDPLRDLVLKPFTAGQLLERLDRRLRRSASSSAELEAVRDSSARVSVPSPRIAER